MKRPWPGRWRRDSIGRRRGREKLSVWFHETNTQQRPLPLWGAAVVASVALTLQVICDKEYTYQFVILNEVKDLLFKQKQIFAVAQDDTHMRYY